MTDDERAAHPKPAWSWWVPLVCVLLVVISVVSVGTFLRATTGAATSQDIKDTQAQDRITRARQDCARKVAAERNVVIDMRDNSTSEAVLAVLDGIAQGRVTPSGVEDVRAELRASIAAVLALPAIDKEVDRRCPG